MYLVPRTHCRKRRIVLSQFQPIICFLVGVFWRDFCGASFWPKSIFKIATEHIHMWISSTFDSKAKFLLCDDRISHDGRGRMWMQSTTSRQCYTESPIPKSLEEIPVVRRHYSHHIPKRDNGVASLRLCGSSKYNNFCTTFLLLSLTSVVGLHNYPSFDMNTLHSSMALYLSTSHPYTHAAQHCEIPTRKTCRPAFATEGLCL